MPGEKITLQDAKRIWEELFGCSDFLNKLEMWKRIQAKQLPFLGELEERDKWIKPDAGIIDGTAFRADQIFAGGMASGSVPQTVQWFDLRCDEMEDDQLLKILVQQQRDDINNAINRSDFYNSMYQAYLELPFGQAPRGCFWLPDRGLKFEAYSVGSYAYALDSLDEVTYFAVKKDMSLSKLAFKFGVESLPDNLQRQFKEKKNLSQEHKVYWLLARNPGYNRRTLGSFPYVSLYWMDGCKEQFIHEGGFESCPITIMRYLALPNSDYGIGPGWFADSDVRIMYDMLKAAAGNMELFYNAPLQAPAGVEVDYRPGAVTTVTSQGKVESLFNIAPVFNEVFAKAAEREERIQAAYNVNLFAMLSQEQYDDPHRTAFEWSLRQQEKMQQLTPVITRINNEVLSRDIKRIYQIYRDNGAWEMPPQYNGVDLEIEYISPLAKLQKMSGVQDYESALAAIGNTAQLKPQVVDMLDESVFLRGWLDDIGVHAKILRSDEEYQEIQAEKAQQAQQQMQMQQELAAAEVMPNVTEAAANLQQMADQGGSPLDTLVSGLRSA